MAYNDITFHVSTEALKETAQQVRSLVSALRQDFGKVGNIARNTQSYWQGPAGGRTREAFAAQLAEVEEILTLIGRYPQDLLKIAGVYDSGEANVTSMVNSLPTFSLR